jgi:hypothetical protein
MRWSRMTAQQRALALLQAQHREAAALAAMTAALAAIPPDVIEARTTRAPAGEACGYKNRKRAGAIKSNPYRHLVRDRLQGYLR